ncbi:MAG: hypothetical protein ACI9IL_000713 [Rickettsiales bacterium]|jgi:hypothetical protein
MPIRADYKELTRIHADQIMEDIDFLKKDQEEYEKLQKYLPELMKAGSETNRVRIAEILDTEDAPSILDRIDDICFNKMNVIKASFISNGSKQEFIENQREIQRTMIEAVTLKLQEFTQEKLRSTDEELTTTGIARLSPEQEKKLDLKDNKDVFIITREKLEELERRQKPSISPSSKETSLGTIREESNDSQLSR